MTGTPLPPPLFNNGKKVDNPDVSLPTIPAAKSLNHLLDKSNTLEDTASSNEETVTPEIETRKSRAAKKEKKPFFPKKASKDQVPDKVNLSEENIDVSESEPVTATKFDELLKKSPDSTAETDTLVEKVPNKNRKVGVGIFGVLTVGLIGAIVYALGTVNGLF